MKKILLIDDNDQDIMLFRRTFKKLDFSNLGEFQLSVMKSGKEIKENMATLSYDIVFLDQQLPDAKGEDLLKILLESHGKKPIIMYSNCDLEAFKLRCIEYGAAEFISKYIRLQKLQELLEKHAKAG